MHLILDLGLQTTELISDSKEPLSTFAAVVNNFPLLAKTISKRPKPDQKLLEKLVSFQRRFHLFPQVEVLAINGLLIESVGFSMHGLQSFASRYSTFYDLVKSKLDHEKAEKVLQAAIISQTPTFDTRSEAVVMLNDLETDELYAKDPKTLKSILRHSQTGFFQLSRNLVTATLFLDPRHEKTGEILAGLKKGWIDAGAPMRFGLVLTNSEGNDYVAVFIRSFYAVHHKHGLTAAISFLEEVFYTGFSQC